MKFDDRDIIVLMLLDKQADIEAAIQQNPDIKNLAIRGFSGNKPKFTLAYINELLYKRYSSIWFDHINLAPFMIIANIMRIEYSMMVYGIEVLRSLSFIKKVALSKAKKIISISNHTKIMAQKWSNVFKKAEVCSLGIDLKLPQALRNNSANTLSPGFLSQKTRSSLTGKLKTQNPKLKTAACRVSVVEHEYVFKDRKTILIVARMDANEAYSKGHQELIEVVALLNKRLPEILLIIVGRGSAKNLFEKLVAEKKTQNNVLFTGFVPDEKLHAAAKEVILDGETGYCVDPYNIKELAECLFKLLADDELRKKMGKAGQKRYLENFTEQKFHERFLRIIGNV